MKKKIAGSAIDRVPRLEDKRFAHETARIVNLMSPDCHFFFRFESSP